MIKSELKLSYLLFFALIGFLGWDDVSDYLFGPKPYENVHIALAEIRDGKFNLVADFKTLGCKFRLMEVVSFGLGGSEVLKWVDNDGLGQNHERSQGDHTSRITATLVDDHVDKIEVRTRHLCDFELDENEQPVGGVYVNRVLMTYWPPAVGP